MYCQIFSRKIICIKILTYLDEFDEPKDKTDGYLPNVYGRMD